MQWQLNIVDIVSTYLKSTLVRCSYYVMILKFCTVHVSISYTRFLIGGMTIASRTLVFNILTRQQARSQKKMLRGANFLEGGSEEFFGEIGLKELHPLCSRCLHFHHAFLNQFQKRGVAEYSIRSNRKIFDGV